MKMFFLLLTLVTTSVFADAKNYLKITSYTDLSAKNCKSLDTPKVFKVDANFVNKTYCLEFYAFLDSDDVADICFVGKPALALETIDTILGVSTGDAYVYPAAKAKVTSNLVSRDFNYEDEGGEHSESAVVPVCK